VTRHHNLINGQWVEGTAYAPNQNPSNLDDIIGEYAQGDAAQVDDAMQAARRAFAAWSVTGIQARCDALDRIGSEILQRKDELGTLLAREEGKTRAEGIGEAARAGNIFRFFAGECLRTAGEVLPSVRPGIGIEVTREPLGVVALISPWNFPLAIPAWKIAPALAYGNCVVFKPADLVPGCAWALADIIHRAGLPAGAFHLVMGRGSVIGDALVTHPEVDAVSFTGSQSVGQRLAQCGDLFGRGHVNHRRAFSSSREPTYPQSLHRPVTMRSSRNQPIQWWRFQATRSYKRWGCRCTTPMSIPSSSQCSCSTVSMGTASGVGQMKRSCSSRLSSSQKPLRSQPRIFTRLRRRLLKT